MNSKICTRGGLWTLLFVMTALLTLPAAPVGAQNETAASDDLRIAFVSNRLGNEDIYLMTQQGEAGPVTNLTSNPARDWNPAWSPGGNRLLFNSDRDGRDTLYVMDSDGTNARPLFPGETFNDYDASWSHDGTRIVFVSDRSGAGRELYLANSDGSGVEPFVVNSQLKGDPIWSPDGQSILYWQQENNGQIHLYRHSVTSNSFQLLTSVGTANGSPVWIGSTIYFDTDREGFWSVYQMDENGSFPERFSAAGVNSGRPTVSPDGRRIAFVTDRDESDEIYVANADRLGVRRLTNNGYSDHSPVWQPAIPDNQIRIEATPVPEAAPASDTTAALAPAVGLSVNGVIARPITMAQLLIDYGIAAWHEAGWTGAGQRIGVIDTAFGDINRINQMREVLLPPNHSRSVYNDDLNDHGSDVLEVIHAIAPNADLYACLYNGTLNELDACVDWMIDSDIDIINHSVGLPILPIDGQNDWAKLVDQTVSEGVLWVNSAGNFNLGYMRGNFLDGDGDGIHDFVFGSQKRDLIVPISGSYTGTILLSWLEGNITVTDPRSGVQGRINLDLEIISTATGAVLNPTSGREQQNSDPNRPPAEIVRLVDVTEPFAIRIRNASGNLTQRIPFAIFVEFAPLEFTDVSGSIVAPGDAASAFTIGSVNGIRELAAYSSRGLDDVTEYTKPDISAPGEIILKSDGSTFIGTSAAAPVISAVAALLREQNPALTIDQIPRVMKDIWIHRQRSLAYGAGIIQLGPPPSSRIGDLILDTSPKTVFPQEAEVEFSPIVVSCGTLLSTRFEVGVPGYANYDLGLNLRLLPTERSASLGILSLGDRFDVIGGPVCAESMYWWLVELGTGAEAWVGEGARYYLIAPQSLDRGELPDRYDNVCPNAPDSFLEIGDRARLLRGNLFFFRGLGARATRGEQRPLPGNTIVQILGGPVCEDNGSVIRWYVRVLDGERAGAEGWLAEGVTTERQMVPLTTD